MFETFNNYKLQEDECVHHIDENILNNDLNNFKLMNKSEHSSFHNFGENNSMFGKHHSEKSRKSISEKKQGENNPSSKLTEQDIIEIRKLCGEGILTQKEIAKIFKVSPATVSGIKRGKYWK